MPLDEQAYRSWLATQELGDGARSDQLSRARRIEEHLGDLDEAFDQDGLESILSLLSYGSADLEAGRPLPAGLAFQGDPVSGMRSLKSAAKKFQAYKMATTATGQGRRFTSFEPILRPRPAPGRQLEPTGFWMFQANPERYDTDAWIAAREASLLYLVSPEDAALIQPGDLAILRRTAHRHRPAALVAFFEISTWPELLAQPDTRFFVNPDEGRPQMRVKLELLAVPDQEIPMGALPKEPAFRHVRQGLQRTSTAIPSEAFELAARMAGLSPLDVAARRNSTSLAGIRELERIASNLDPRHQQVISRRIERGPIGAKVKELLGGQCQICVQLGLDPVAFRKLNGTPYSEAHHVTPVSMLAPGSLAAANIMVLCPNHHRQVHHGAFEMVEDLSDRWSIRLDGRGLTISKTII